MKNNKLNGKSVTPNFTTISKNEIENLMKDYQTQLLKIKKCNIKIERFQNWGQTHFKPTKNITMKINRTKLNPEGMGAFNKVDLFEMLDNLKDRQELLSDVKTGLLEDELYPNEYAIQTGQIDEQLIYINHNIMVVEEALMEHISIDDLN